MCGCAQAVFLGSVRSWMKRYGSSGGGIQGFSLPVPGWVSHNASLQAFVLSLLPSLSGTNKKIVHSLKLVSACLETHACILLVVSYNWRCIYTNKPVYYICAQLRMHIEKHTGVLTIWVVSFCWNRLLKALGAAERTRIYWAGGEPFGGKQKALEPIRKAFPELHNKDSLATAEELMPFKNKASSLAAIDYLVCLKSGVFLQSHGGNFGHLMHVCQLLIFLLIPTFLSIPILYLRIECMVPVGYRLLQANSHEREE